jgi:hypothetical protein
MDHRLLRPLRCSLSVLRPGKDAAPGKISLRRVISWRVCYHRVPPPPPEPPPENPPPEKLPPELPPENPPPPELLVVGCGRDVIVLRILLSARVIS